MFDKIGTAFASLRFYWYLEMKETGPLIRGQSQVQAPARVQAQAGSATDPIPQSSLPDSSMEELQARSETVTEVLRRFMTRSDRPLFHSLHGS